MLNRDFKEFIQSLNSNKVKYLIIGGYALAVHGIPRYTKDLDVWVLNDTENAERLLKALSEFGFGSLGLRIEDFTASSVPSLTWKTLRQTRKRLDASRTWLIWKSWRKWTGKELGIIAFPDHQTGSFEN